MSTLAPSPAVVNPTTWFVPCASVAFTFGAQDAASGLICVPEMYFRHIDDQRDYCAGFASVAGESITTRQFLGSVN